MPGGNQHLSFDLTLEEVQALNYFSRNCLVTYSGGNGGLDF